MTERDEAVKAAADALRNLAPGHECRRIWGRAAAGPAGGVVSFGTLDPDDQGPAGTVWAADTVDIARVVLDAADHAAGRREPPLTVTHDLARAACASLGLPNDLVKVVIDFTKRRITVTQVRFDRDGIPVAAGDRVAMVRTIIGIDDSEPIALVEPTDDATTAGKPCRPIPCPLDDEAANGLWMTTERSG